MKAIIAIITITSALLFLHSCYYDSEEFLFPETGNTCDTTSVTYAQSVAPILRNNCLACHSNGSAAGLGGNVRLEDYADVKLKADEGKLLGVISHAPGFVPMPQGAPKLDDCSISVIRIWIEEGGQNN
jgi:hypothetical protein